MAKEDHIIQDIQGNKIYLFKDDELQSSLLDNLNMLRKNRQFCDCILQVGSNQDTHQVYAHKVVLSSSSPYFLDMFSNEPSITGQANNVGNCLVGNGGSGLPQYRINLNNSGMKNSTTSEFDPEAFEYIVEYAYTAELQIPSNKVREIYAIASRLKMSSVAMKCGQVLLSTLSLQNCLEIRNMKTVLKDPFLLQSVDGYIRQNFEKIVETSSFKSQQLSQIKIEFLLNSEKEEHCINDRHIFNEVLEWIRYSMEKDTIDLDTLKDNNSLLMLYFNKDRNEIQDCSQIESNSPEESEMIEDYKKLSKRISMIKSLSNDSISTSVIVGNGNGNVNTPNRNQANKSTMPSKPRQFLFTRSDSESSLSSIADDDDGQDWKVLATCRIGNNHTLVGLVSINGQLYLLSITLRVKETTESKETDGISDEYCLLTPMNYPRCSVGVAEYNGKLFACGGYDRTECLKVVELYDIETNRWEQLQPMQRPRGRFAIAVIDQKVYAIGGSDGHNELNSAEYFDGHEWKSVQNAPLARTNVGVCSMNSKIYVIGGQNNNRGMAHCDIYDPLTDTWSEMVPMNEGRYQTGACVFNNTIYAVGGCDSWACKNSVEAFYNGVWRNVAPLQTARRGCGVAVFNGKIYAVGGHDGYRALCSVEIYDPDLDEWTFGKSMTIARANVGVAVVRDKLYAVGGFTGKTFLNSIEYYDFETDQWTTSIPIKQCSTTISKAMISSGDSINDKNNNNKINNNNRGKSMNSMKSNSNSLGSEPLMEVEETIVGH